MAPASFSGGFRETLLPGKAATTKSIEYTLLIQLVEFSFCHS